MEYRKCFVLTCKNDSKNSPDKIFVRIREDLKEKWCREAKAECFKIYRMYCCEDHLEPREDLINYYQCKLMNEEPKLKRSALLRNIGQDTNEGLSELNKLLLKPPSTSQPLKRKHDDFDKSKSSTSPSKSKLFKRIEDIAVPGTSTCSTLPINVEEADICDDNMNNAEDDSNTPVESNDEEAVICDDNMDDAEDDTNTLVESNVCRVCLAMDVKMYDLKDTELRVMFQNVTGICVPENNHSILERLCWECVGRLKTAAALRNKALVSDTLLQGLANTGEQIRKNDITTIKENKEYIRPAGTLSVVEVFHPVDIDPENDSEPHILENNDTNIVEHTVGKDSHEIKKENIIDEDGDQLAIKDEPMIEYPIKTETDCDHFDYLCPNTGEDSRNVFTKTNPLVGNDISLSKNKISLPDSSPLPGCSHADPKYPVVGSLQNTLNNCKDKIKTNAILVINKKDLNAKIVFKKPKVLLSDKSKNINVNIGGVSKKILIINEVTKTQVNTHTGEECQSLKDVQF